MKISLKLENGSLLEFEGDAEDFQRVAAFLEDPPDSLTSGASARRLVPSPADDGNGDAPEWTPSLEPSVVAAELERVGASNDQERVTVMAHLAKASGKEGIDYSTVEYLYTELALRKPAQFPYKTFSNAKSSGLVQPVKPGIWRPTYRGENFASGHGRGQSSARRTARPKGSNGNEGGESD